MNGLTPRQKRVLSFLREYARRHGYPPTIREIRTAFGLSSNRGVVDHLLALERKGCIKRTPGISRAIEIVAPPSPREGNASEARAYPLAGRIAAGRPEAPGDGATAQALEPEIVPVPQDAEPQSAEAPENE